MGHRTLSLSTMFPWSAIESASHSSASEHVASPPWLRHFARTSWAKVSCTERGRRNLVCRLWERSVKF